MQNDLEKQITGLFGPNGLVTYSHIYMIEQTMHKLEEDEAMLAEFKDYIETDRFFRKGWWYNDVEYFWFRTQPIFYSGTYKIVYFFFTTKQLIVPKWDTKEIQPPFGIEIKNEITHFYNSAILDKQNWAIGKRQLK